VGSTVTIKNTYNELGSLMRTVTTGQSLTVPMFEQGLAYARDGLIANQASGTDGELFVHNYGYDPVNRLVQWNKQNQNLQQLRSENYEYDRVGNRTLVGYDNGTAFGAYQYSPPTSNKLTEVIDAGVHDYINYNANGAMVTRTKNSTTNGFKTQKMEAYSYDAFGLVEKFTVKAETLTGVAGVGCEADATNAPLSDWRYQFSPLQEREQKRQYATSGDVLAEGLGWVYTALGADKKQLATYNGIEGTYCGEVNPSVWLWPVEYDSYGPAGTRVMTRPDATKEFVISDHLGSVRAIFNEQGQTVQRLDYESYGKELVSEGTGARTSFIGRERDGESDLGFFGVRLYDQQYGRFLSTDKMWEKYQDQQPFQYSVNAPTRWLDFSGMDTTQRAQCLERVEDYLKSASVYRMAKKGIPGEPVDCSGMVSNCVTAGGEPDPNRGNKGSGVLNIESNLQKVDASQVVPGNIVTFHFKTTGYAYHTGIVTKTVSDANGELLNFTAAHSSSSKNGPTTSVVDLTKKESFLGKRCVRILEVGHKARW